jgi:hypothetical protein
MDQIEVNDNGVEVLTEIPPMVSMYGKVMRAGATFTNLMPWFEISGISLSAIRLPPDGRLLLTLEIDLTWGEFVTVSRDAVGFAAAVVAIAARSDVAEPDLSTFDGDVSLWP